MFSASYGHRVTVPKATSEDITRIQDAVEVCRKYNASVSSDPTYARDDRYWIGLKKTGDTAAPKMDDGTYSSFNKQG